MTSIFEYNKEEEERKLRRAEYELGVRMASRSELGKEQNTRRKKQPYHLSG